MKSALLLGLLIVAPILDARVVVDADKDRDVLVAKEAKVSAAAVIYTCPMHPEVKESVPGKCQKCGMNLEKKRDRPETARVTVRGQVVCSNCWHEADRRTTAYGTPADLKCAAVCEKDAVPAALAVEEKSSFRLYGLEDGAFRREGRGWLNYIAKRVEIAGFVRREKNRDILRVDSLKVIEKQEAGAVAPADHGHDPKR